jgi:hypothetical protein
MKTLQGEASDILREWVDGRYCVFYKWDGERAFQIELFERETKTTFLPNEETEHFLEIILDHE